jgi:serine/threonine protein kinase/tetratricopeptide (TPR) repeat protein
VLARDLHAGDVLDGKYRIVAPIGRGGMGAVYSAQRLALGDHVAVKLLLPGDHQEVSRARFLREAKAAARIRHPSVVQVFDYGDPDGGAPYIVMELLEGPTLAEELRRAGPLPVERALSLFADICAAVEAGHRRGVVHRDLKPGNVILARTDDGGEIVKVLDFGIATVAGLLDATTLTGPGALLGTYCYMAPEQASGGTAGPGSDVFSLGVVLYEMLTRQLPFAAATPIAAMMRLARGDHTPVASYAPGLAPPLVAAIEAALSLEVARRPPSPEALARLVGAPVRSARNMRDSIPDTAEPDRLEAPSGVRESWSDATMLDVGPPDLEKHFVGRTQEVARLDEQLRAARGGNGKLALVTGDAGTGKTRLVQFFARRAADAGNEVLSARFYDYEGSRLQSFDGIERMLGEPPSTPTQVEHPDSERDVDKWRRFAAMTDAVARRAERGPLLLAFDDLQWATGVELELVAHLQRTLDPKRVLLVATARTPEPDSELSRWVAQLVQRNAAAIVELRPLSSEHVREWLLAAFGTLRIRPSDRRRIERATGNNPQYLLELVRHLLTTGAVHRDELHGGGDWSCADLENVTLPESMSSVVRAKLDDLDEPLRGMLEIAAVIGHEQRVATLSAATGLPEPELEALVDAAIELRLLTDAGVSAGEDVRFASETARRVLYDDMTTRRRRRAHQRVVLALEEMYARDLRRIARVLCYHHYAVGAWVHALSWGIAAAEDDLSRHANDAAEASLQRARDAARQLKEAGEEPPPSDLARLDGLSGTLYVRLGRFAEASELLTRAVARLDGPPAHRIDALLDLAQCWLGRGDYERALAAAGEAGDRAAEAADATRTLVARVLRAGCFSRLGRLLEAEAVLGPAIELAGADVALGARAQALRELSWIATKRGAFAEAEARAREALDLARTAGDPVGQHGALSALAAAYNEGGDPASALPFQTEALRIARALSLRRREAIELANLGESHMSLGHVALAERHFREALAIFLEIDDRACEGDCRVNLGRALLAGGARAAAIAMLERGRKLCEATGRVEYAAIALVHLGEAHRVQGDLARAEEVFREARRLFVEQASHHVWRASLGLAAVALARGDSAEAVRHAGDARERLLAQREALAVGASADAIDKSLGEVAYVVEIATGRAPA